MMITPARILLSVVVGTVSVSAFSLVPLHSGRAIPHSAGSVPPAASAGTVLWMVGSDATTSTATDFLKELIPSLARGDGGSQLLGASSDSWRAAIFEAVGASDATMDEAVVATILQDAMSKSDNQFAILMGKAEQFVATFPSDVVDYKNDGTAWVECRLRNVDTDELLVTMGISVVQRGGGGGWLISSLDWQDFREQFYPGLSGREWVRAF